MPRFSSAPLLFAVASLASLSLAACGDDKLAPAPCDSDAKPAYCDTACSPTLPCPTGAYCGTGGTCTSDCAVGGGQCGSGMTCDPRDGKCVPDSSGDGGSGGGTGGGTGGGSGGGSGNDGGPNSCQDLEVTAEPVVPYIVFVVDKSGSMNQGYDDTSRWRAVRRALVGTDGGRGIIGQFESAAYIGVVQYTGVHNDNSSPWDFDAPWPQLEQSTVALNNRDNIAVDYDSTNPPNKNDTPTGEALWVTLCRLGQVDTDGDGVVDARLGCDAYTDFVSSDTNELPAGSRADATAPLLLPTVAEGRDPRAPIILVVATDGQPNSSNGPNADESNESAVAIEARMISLAAAKEAREAGISTYVISVAGSNALQQHLKNLACEGGTGGNPGGAPYTASNADQCSYAGNTNGPGAVNVTDSATLNDALTTIVTSSIPCNFELEGKINDVALARMQGVVSVGGTPVSLDQTNGWYLLDNGYTFTLNGAACDAFRANPGTALDATFPCGSGGGIVIEPR